MIILKEGGRIAMEFGFSPTVASLRDMANSNNLFDTPAFPWVAAETRVSASRRAFLVDVVMCPSEVNKTSGLDTRIQFQCSLFLTPR